MSEKLVIHGNFTAAQKRIIEGALDRGLLSNKALALHEGVTPDAIQSRWDRIADKLHLPWGQRTRAHVITTLVRSKAVEYLMLTLAVLIGSGFYDMAPAQADDNPDSIAKFRYRRGRRNNRRRVTSDNGNTIDFDYEWGGLIFTTPQTSSNQTA